MGFDKTIRSVFGEGEETFQIYQRATGSALLQIDEEVGPDTNVTIDADIDVSALKGIGFSVSGIEGSGGDCTVAFTGSSYSIAATADFGFVWVANNGVSNPLNADVTAISVENTTGAAVRVQLGCVLDATP